MRIKPKLSPPLRLSNDLPIFPVSVCLGLVIIEALELTTCVSYQILLYSRAQDSVLHCRLVGSMQQCRTDIISRVGWAGAVRLTIWPEDPPKVRPTDTVT